MLTLIILLTLLNSILILTVVEFSSSKLMKLTFFRQVGRQHHRNDAIF